MKNIETILGVAAIAAVGALVICGCRTSTIPVTMKVAGDIKLTGVSKIAIVDFNSLPGDPFSGNVAADSETCALIQRAVSSAFYKTPTCQIANLTDEEAIAAVQSALPNKRFDAFVTGQVWWQMPPETDGEYFEVYTLDSWRNVPYTVTVKNPITRKEEDVSMMANHLLTQQRDDLQQLKYRARTATLMLALSFYRVDNNGNLTKIVDFYQVSKQGFLLLNGSMSSESVDIGMKNDNSVMRLQDTGKAKGSFSSFMKSESKAPAGIGNSILTQKTITMPTELQAKLMLAAKITDELASKVAPSEVTFEANWSDDDEKLTNLVNNRAWGAMKDYAAFMIRNNVGKELSMKIAALEDIPVTYPVPASKENFTLDGSEKDQTKDMIGYFVKQDVPLYLYALGLAQEASGDAYVALDTYTEAFNMNPTKDIALGISRCDMAIGQAKRVNEVNKEKNKAAKKTKLD